MVRFRLQRFAIVTPQVPKAIDSVPRFQIGDVALLLSPVIGAKQQRFALVATTHFDAPSLSGMNDANVVDARTKCERAMVAAHEMITTSSGHALTIRSSWPLFAVAWPEGTKPDVGNDEDWIRSLATFRPTINIPFFDLVRERELLADRPSGVLLLAQALSNIHPVGKFVALCRVLEDAFAEPASINNSRKITTFLDGASLEYSEGEVSTWISIRGSGAHGDLKHHISHATELDAIPLIPRLQQAVYDVLFNKSNWHTSDLDRRRAWYPSTAFLRDQGHMQVTVGIHTSIGQEEFDPFTGWPMSDDGRVEPSGDCKYPRLQAQIPMKITSVNPPFPRRAPPDLGSVL